MTTQRPFSSWTAADWARSSLLILLFTWVPAMFKSLWIDELGSYWTISGSLVDTISRAIEVQGQSPFTYVLMWAWNAALSPSDFVLRVLPVIFGLGTLALLFSIGKRIAGKPFGWYAVAAAVSLYELRAMIVNFRPYAFALFFLVLSTRLLMAWDDKPTVPVTLGYIVATAGAVWSVFYFGFALIAHVVFLAVRRAEGSQRSWQRFGIMAVSSVILCLPFVPQLLALSARADNLQFSGTPMIRSVLSGLIPLGMAGAWLIVVLVCGLPDKLPGRRSDRALILSTFVVPSVILYALTATTDLGLWTVRYRSSFLLGFALAAALWIAGYSNERIRTRAILILLVVGVLISPPNDFASGQDWRAGLQHADTVIAQDGLIILGSGLVEATSLDALEDPTVSQFIAAPLSRYPVSQEVLLAPFLEASVTYPYLVDKLAAMDHLEIAVVSLQGDLPGYEAFGAVLAPLGFTEVGVELFGRVEVIVYERDE